MKTNNLFQNFNRDLLSRLLPKKEFAFCKSNKELIDKLIKEIGICLN